MRTRCLDQTPLRDAPLSAHDREQLDLAVATLLFGVWWEPEDLAPLPDEELGVSCAG